MIRHACRLVIGFAVALAMTFTTAAVAGTANAAPAAAPAPAAAAVNCSSQQAAYNAALAHQRELGTKLHRAKARLKVAKHQLHKAQRHHQAAKVHRLKAKVKKLKKRVHRLYNQRQTARTATQAAHTALTTCQAGGGGGGGTGDPIQSLCDAGIPQAVCDALAGLVGGGLPSDLSLQALCDAVPQLQPICDAAGGGGLPTDPSALTDLLKPLLDAIGLGDLLGGGLPSDLTSIQALCDAGAPQPVCDALAGLAGGGLPSDVSLQALCDAVPQAQALCDAVNGGGLPSDPTDLTALLSPVLDALGLGGLLGGLPLSELTSIQAICDAGAPQQICDALAGEVPGGAGLPSAVTLQQLCDAAPEAQSLCDAVNGGGLPSDPTALTGLLTPVLQGLGLGNLLDLLGGILPPPGRAAA
ncbi:hypothetical protein [Nocardioides panacisoli]|uniref:Secreted protein n=1 Tax=Nocardioides panacisoli TaxID=627624 RepID=A0ABP7IS10_9ACTN